MLEEHWSDIPEFPNYCVSDLGAVVNKSTGRYLIQTMATGGTYKVGLVRAGKQYTRSVKVLVAEAFVEGQSEIFNTPIQLDGYQENMRWDNLMWRPRWFAWKYTRQFSEVSDFNRVGWVHDTVMNRT